MDNSPLALIIEDDPELVAIFARALQEAGYKTETATDGATALTRLAATIPAVVMLDLHLPSVSGEDIFRRIRDDERLATTQVVLATADSRRAQYLRDEADLVLLKPISFRQLRDLTKRLCSL